MSESLLENTLEDAPGDKPAQGGALDKSARPYNLPEKFWDSDLGQIRIEALVKSYLELERKMGTASARPVPSTPQDYKIAITHELLESDPYINQKLHTAGFTQEQAQLVYDLASERLMPMVTEIASMFEAEAQISRLEQYFGSEEKWREIARQLDAWGRKQLPLRVFEALSSTYEGILAMYRMFSGAEPGLQALEQTNNNLPSESSVRQMMRDPRYWRDQDPVVVDRVREGFKRIYQDVQA